MSFIVTKLLIKHNRPVNLGHMNFLEVLKGHSYAERQELEKEDKNIQFFNCNKIKVIEEFYQLIVQSNDLAVVLEDDPDSTWTVLGTKGIITRFIGMVNANCTILYDLRQWEIMVVCEEALFLDEKNALNLTSNVIEVEDLMVALTDISDNDEFSITPIYQGYTEDLTFFTKTDSF